MTSHLRRYYSAELLICGSSPPLTPDSSYSPPHVSFWWHPVKNGPPSSVVTDAVPNSLTFIFDYSHHPSDLDPPLSERTF